MKYTQPYRTRPHWGIRRKFLAQYAMELDDAMRKYETIKSSNAEIEDIVKAFEQAKKAKESLNDLIAANFRLD